MSGLTDALLEEIAENSKVEIELLQKLVDQSAGGGAGGGSAVSAPYTAVGKSFKTLGFVVGVASGIIGGAFSTALNIASSGLRTLTSMGTQLFQAQQQLAETAIAGTGSLSSFYDSLSNLPGILGLMARVFSYHTKVLEVNLNTFQKMAQSGATLGGNLDMVRQSAKGMYLSMDEFANVMNANVGVIRMLGGTADEGARNLIRFNTQLIQGNVGRQLLGMGHTIEEVNTMLASYASIVGGVRESDLKNQKKMEQSVKTFATELDLAAQLEGKTRKEKEDALKKAAQQAAVQAMLAGMDNEARLKYNTALADAESRGQGYVDLLHSQILGFPPMTEAAQLAAAMNYEAAEAVKRNGDIVNENTTFQQAQGELHRNRARADAATVETFERMGQTGRALTFSMDATGEAVRDMAKRTADARNMGVETEERGRQRIEETLAAQERAQNSLAGSTAQAAGRAKYQGEWLMNMLYSLFKPLEPVLLGLVSVFQQLATTVIPFVTDLFKQVIIPLFNSLFGDLDMEDIVSPFRDFFKGFFGEDTFGLKDVKNRLEAVLKPLTEAIGDFFNSVDWTAVGAGMRTVFDNLLIVGELVGSVLIGAIKLVIGAFDLIVSVGTALYRIIDYLLEPFGGMAEVVEGPLISAFNSLKSLLVDTVIPWFNSLGEKLSGFASWIDESTRVIQGPLKTALDVLRAGLVGMGTIIGIQKGLEVARNGWIAGHTFVTKIATGVMSGFSYVVGLGKTIMSAWQLIMEGSTVIQRLKNAAMLLTLGPLGLIVVAATAVGGIFYWLYSRGDSVSTVLGTLKNKFEWFMDQLGGLWDRLLNYFGFMSDEDLQKANEEREKAQKLREKRDRELEDERKENLAARESTNEPAPAAATAASLVAEVTAVTAPVATPTPPPMPTVPVPTAPAVTETALNQERSSANFTNASNMATGTMAGVEERMSRTASLDLSELNMNIRRMVDKLDNIESNTKDTVRSFESSRNYLA